MAFVTYLLGAGAGADCLLVANDIPEILMASHKLFGDFFSRQILSTLREITKVVFGADISLDIDIKSPLFQDHSQRFNFKKTETMDELQRKLPSN